MKTKNYEIYLNFYVHLWRWALLFEIDLETICKDLIEINLDILCFSFSFVGIHKNYQAELDKMFHTMDEEANEQK